MRLSLARFIGRKRIEVLIRDLIFLTRINCLAIMGVSSFQVWCHIQQHNKNRITLYRIGTYDRVVRVFLFRRMNAQITFNRGVIFLDE